MTPATHSIQELNRMFNHAADFELTDGAPMRMTARFSSVQLLPMPEEIVFEGVSYGHVMAVCCGLAFDAQETGSDVEIVCIGVGAQSCEFARRQLQQAAVCSGTGGFQCEIELLAAFEVEGEVRARYVVGTLAEASA